MNQTRFSWQNAGGLKIFGQEWRPEGESRGVVALVHGLGEHTGRYQHVAETLNQAGYGVIGFDLAGHGQSEGTRGHTSYEETLAEIDHLLREASTRYPGKAQFLYGHSLGGALVLYYALKRRPTLNGFIATSPGLATGESVSAAKLLLAKTMAVLYPAFTLPNGLDQQNLSHDTAVIQAYRDDALVHDRISARLGLDLLTSGAWMQSQAVHFPGPLLLVQGDQDHLVSPRATQDFAEQVPADKITYKVWEGLYHETHNELNKAQVIQYMVEWINQHNPVVVKSESYQPL